MCKSAPVKSLPGPARVNKGASRALNRSVDEVAYLSNRSRLLWKQYLCKIVALSDEDQYHLGADHPVCGFRVDKTLSTILL